MITIELCPRKRHYRCNLVVRQMQEICLILNKYIFMAFLDLEKQLTVPLENLSSESSESYVTQKVNTNAQSHICVVYNYSQEIKVNGGACQRSALSTLLIILMIWCRETIDIRQQSDIKVEPDRLEVVDSFLLPE